MISYNILDGGEGRADPIAEIIEAQRPDVVALVEADDKAVIERIAGRLGMDWIQGVGQGDASALLTRWTIVDSINHGALQNEMSNSFLEVTVRDPQGRQWPMGVAHLKARAFEENEREREKELAVVLEVFKRHREAGRAHLLMGDFNANAPLQRIDPDRCKETTRRAWQANGGQVPRRVVRKVLDSGYVDVLHAVRGEYAETTGTFTTQQPGQRVDYVFSFGVERNSMKEGWIEQDRLAKYASDHFPVVVEII